MLFDPPECPAEAVFSRRDKRLRAFIVPAEPVGKYLIPHGIARPGGRGVVLRRIHIRHLKRSKELFRKRLRDPRFGEKHCFPVFQNDLEMIPELSRLHFKRDRIERVTQKCLFVLDRQRMEVGPPSVPIQKPERVAEHNVYRPYRLVAAKAERAGAPGNELPRVVRAMLHGIV